ncbi:DUF3369 domain-containing protein [Salinispirillum sp. LH 10-3-1]|uniref:DUF3369 domain-containing protein n=1 Tax=Salinispirillum sp. LH 10-3-1 TaxID=2952525 RepID=A0AB38YE12_9GAMM
MSDELLFAGDETPATGHKGAQPWTILIVDDDESIHQVTILALKQYQVEGRDIRFLSAYSAAEAIDILQQEPDTALALVDVVMETESAGLELVHDIRRKLHMTDIRLVLRTGQPGQAPEHQVIEAYDINDYKEKTDLTRQKLRTLCYSTLRAYRDLRLVRQQQEGLRNILTATQHTLAAANLSSFGSIVQQQIRAIFNVESPEFWGISMVPDDGSGYPYLHVLQAANNTVLHDYQDKIASLPGPLRNLVAQAMKTDTPQHSDDFFMVYQHSEPALHVFLLVRMPHPDGFQRELLSLFGANLLLIYQSLLLREEIVDTQKELVNRLGNAVEMRSKETGAHVQRVGIIAELLGQHYGLSSYQCELLRHAAPLHDLGKVAIPDAVLHKPAKLEPHEWSVMQSHAQLGHDLLADSKRPILRMASMIALTHHERWDGKGYPRALKQAETPIEGRITALADVFDALGSVRCYKTPWAEEDIKHYLQSQSGAQFEPRLVDLLLAHWTEFTAIRREFPDAEDEF